MSSLITPVKKNLVLIGGFSESHAVLDPFAEKAVENAMFNDAEIVKTAAEYRRKPISDRCAAEAFFVTHSAGIIALAESVDYNPGKYRDSAVAALNGVEPTGLIRQGLGALKVGFEKIEQEDDLPEKMGSLSHPARELIMHPATTFWIPRKVRRFSTTDYLLTEKEFRSGKYALWSDDDSFGFTPDDEAIDELNRNGVFAEVYEGKHNEPLFRPRYASGVLQDLIDTAEETL